MPAGALSRTGHDDSVFVSHSKAELDFGYLIKIRLHPRDFVPPGQTRFMKVLGLEEHMKSRQLFLSTSAFRLRLLKGPYRQKWLLRGATCRTSKPGSDNSWRPTGEKAPRHRSSQRVALSWERRQRSHDKTGLACPRRIRNCGFGAHRFDEDPSIRPCGSSAATPQSRPRHSVKFASRLS